MTRSAMLLLVGRMVARDADTLHFDRYATPEKRAEAECLYQLSEQIIEDAAGDALTWCEAMDWWESTPDGHH